MWPHVIIAGNVGTGKTTVARALALRWRSCCLLCEERGVFLDDYYREPRKFAFLNQLDYTVQFLERCDTMAAAACPIVEDRSIFDTHEVFTRMLARRRMISVRQLAVLNRLYQVIAARSKPTLLLFLDVSEDVSLRRLRLRGDRQERRVTIDYVRRLGAAYRDWFKRFDLCEKKLVRTDGMALTELAQACSEVVLPA